MTNLTDEYLLLSKQLTALLEGEHHFISNLSQFSALIFNALPDLNWAGFYLALNNRFLQLGPFQGQVACSQIPIGQGVCGSVAEKQQSLRVADVEQFSGHIACDSRSRSELVCPLIIGEKLVAVFDMDSPKLHRFTQDDQRGIENLLRILGLMSNDSW